MKGNKRKQPQNNQTQIITQLNKQNLKQLESQTYSNRTLARLISTAELYALSLGYKTSQLYKKFDQFNNLKRKNPDELLGELILQIQCTKVSITSYISKYQKYDLPEDFDMNKTILELENIRKQVRKRDKKYYKAIIQLIKGDTNIPNFDQELDDLENDDEEEKGDSKDPQLQLKMDIPIMRYVDSIKNQVKNKYEKDPSYKVKLDLNKPFEKNEYFENLVQVQQDIDSNTARKNGRYNNSTENNNEYNQNNQYTQYNQNNQFNQNNQYNQNNQCKNEEHKYAEFY